MKNLIYSPANQIIVLAIFLFLIYFLLTNKKRKLRKEVKRKLKIENGLNYDKTFYNIVLGISKGKALYKKLIIAVHPDRFSGTNKIVEANLLAQRITKAKKNYYELIQIQIEVEKFLNE